MITRFLILTSKFLLIGIFFTTFSCEKDSECEKDGINTSLADLEGSLGGESIAPDIMTGQNFEFSHEIKNLISTCCDETDTAGPTTTNISVDYSDNIDAAFTNLPGCETNDDIESISPGGIKKQPYMCEFQEPGVYRIRSFADSRDVVEERNEENNRDMDDKSILERKKRTLIIHVKDNPNFVKDKTKPQVIITPLKK